VRSATIVRLLSVTLAFAVAPAAAQTVPGGDAPDGDYRDAMAPYVGVFRTDLREAADGSVFRYRYALEWFDPDHTILEMTITREPEGGASDLLWKGFKGWSPAEGRTYYYGFSPQRGRVEGRVFRASDGSLVTVYSGYTPDGAEVKIRDIFGPVRDGGFESVTYMLRDGEWRQIGRDRWERVEESARGRGEEDRVPEPMRRLGHLVGEWEADRVEFLDEAGTVRRVSQAEITNRAYLNGLAIHHQGRLLDPEVEVQGWYYYDPEENRLRMASVSSGGRYDEFVGGWEDGRLVMVAEPRSRDQGRLYRLVHDLITPASFRERLEVSTDGGKTWRVSSRQLFRRAGTASPGNPSL